MLTLVSTIVAGIAGALLPLRWGPWGILGAAAALFVALVGYHTATGFSGASWEESLLLFNGSILSFVGFNAQITYRALAAPLLALSLLFVFRFWRRL